MATGVCLLMGACQKTCICHDRRSDITLDTGETTVRGCEQTEVELNYNASPYSSWSCSRKE